MKMKSIFNMIGFFHSIMWPAIFTLATDQLGKYTTKASPSSPAHVAVRAVHRCFRHVPQHVPHIGHAQRLRPRPPHENPKETGTPLRFSIIIFACFQYGIGK